MKRTALALVLVLVLSLVLTSCQSVLDTASPIITDIKLLLSEPESALEVWENIDVRMDSLESYESKISVNLNLTVEDSKLEAEMLGRSVSMKDYYYQTQRGSMKIDGAETVTEEMLAYVDGKMYVLNSQEDTYSKLYSDVTREEFEEYLTNNNESSVSSALFGNAFTQSFTKNDDATYTIIFEDFPKSDIEKALNDLGLSETLSLINDDVNDIRVEISADSKYRASAINIFFLRDGESKPMIEVKTIYSNYNSAEKVEFDKIGFKAVSDARIPAQVYTYLSDLINKESFDFTFDNEHSVSTESHHQILLSEQDTIHFENDPEDGFTFNIDAVYGSDRYVISYANGAMTTAPASGGETRDSMTEQEARLVIKQLITSLGYDPYIVQSFTDQGDGSYRFNCRVDDESAYRSLISNIGLGAYSGYTLTIQVVMNGDEVERLESNLLIKGTYGKYLTTSVFVFGNASNDNFIKDPGAI